MTWHKMPRLPRNLHLVATSRSADIAIQKTQHDTTKVLRLPGKMTSEVSKVLRLPRKMQRIFENVAKVWRLPYKTNFDASWNMLECDQVPCLPRKTTWQPVLKHSTKMGFAASPIDTATALQKPATRGETCWTIKTSISCETSSNRRFPTSFLTNRGFRRFAWQVTKCHPCQGICTMSPLRAALTMQFAEHTQQDTSKVLHLPRKMTLEVCKVLRLPRKM